ACSWLSSSASAPRSGWSIGTIPWKCQRTSNNIWVVQSLPRYRNSSMTVSGREKRAGVARLDDRLWPLCLGVPVGLLFLLATQLEAKWFFFLFLGSLTFVASLVPTDRKACY